MKNPLLRRSLILTASLLSLAGLAAPFAAHLTVPVEFNQFRIQHWETEYGTLSPEMFWDTLRSTWSSGANALFRWPARDCPSLEEPVRMFSYIFDWIPPHAVVYPTEGFYYFRARAGEKTVWGNLRLADLQNGTVMFTYFVPLEGDVVTTTLTRSDGLAVSRESDDFWSVAWRGKSVRFKFPDTDRTLPRELRMLSEEECAGQIHDESGIRLFLIFNRATNSFYEVLNEEAGVPEEWESSGGPLKTGRRTDFVFYHDADYDRKILIGISLANGYANNYYDGPGDQVPIRIPLRDRLQIAYPSTLMDDGVDDYGVWLNKKDWCRFVVAPFLSYASIGEVESRVSLCDPHSPKSEFWTALTKESWYTPGWLKTVQEKLQEKGRRIPVDDPFNTLRFVPQSAGPDVLEAGGF